IPTVLWARRPEALDQYRDSSATFASSAADLAAQCDVIGVCVLDDAAVRAVVLDPDGVLDGARPGSVIVIHSTVLPETIHEVAAAARAKGVDVLDAPVSGGGQMAAERKLLVIVGGDQAVLDRCLPMLATFGEHVIRVGDLGAGQLAKLVNNVMMAANLGLGNDALNLGEGFGLDRLQLAQVLGVGSGRTYALSVIANMGGTVAPIQSTAGPLLRKDVGLVEATAQRAGASTGILIAAADVGLVALANERSQET
ncbi:MAG TPA: NAD(P)-dependent oxidoreductase, partial [Ilumatobacteraceae bacterium]|nr:NAD(P)-dependent oxidoreductase [Ilumatobacteraceae bacterium]